MARSHDRYGFFRESGPYQTFARPEKVQQRGTSKDEFTEQYTRAREAQADYYADEIIEIADDSQKKFKTVTSMAVIDKLYGLMAKRLNRFHGQQDREETEIGMGLSFCSP